MSAITKYSLLSLPAASFALGVWQIRRLEWKKNLIQDLNSRLSAEPIDLMQIGSVRDLQGMEYRRIKVRGKFDRDPTHQIFLKPRTLIVNKEAHNRGYSEMQTHLGFHVVTPFLLDESDLRILVNRGWIASKGNRDLESSTQQGLGPEDSSIDLTGVLRVTDKKPSFGMRNAENTNVWAHRDIESMARALRTAPIYLEADESLSPTVGPIGGQTQLTVRNEHLNYAITWFSLSFLVLFMWYRKFGRGKRVKLI